MSLSGYMQEMVEKFEIMPKPNNVLRTGNMVQESAAEREYVRKFPLREMLGVLNYTAITLSA